MAVWGGAAKGGGSKYVSYPADSRTVQRECALTQVLCHEGDTRPSTPVSCILLCPSERKYIADTTLSYGMISAATSQSYQDKRSPERDIQSNVVLPSISQDLRLWAAAQEEETPEEERQEGRRTWSHLMGCALTPNSMTTDSLCSELSLNYLSVSG